MVIRILAYCAAMFAWIALAIQAIPVEAAQREDDRLSHGHRTLSITFSSADKASSFTKYDGSRNLILFKASVNGRETTGIIDTGSDLTLIDSSLVKSVGSRETKSDISAQGIGGNFVIYSTDNITVEFQGQFQVKGEFYSRDLRIISERLGTEIGVIIGMDILANVAMAVDSKTSTIAFSSAERMKTRDPQAISLPLHERAFSGEIDGIEADIVIDTGSTAPFSVVSEKWSKFFNQRQLTQLGTGIDVSGRSTLREGVKDASVRLSGFSFKTSAVKLNQKEVSHDAYFGYPMLSIGTVIFNFPRQYVTIIPYVALAN